ncbi:hypothetical protein [uncultured Pontibacter sp.]|uniref:hypothetical protein n=1 Tax=uncultured Pontibacter sp. TaxID=453356 RepID=UPI00262521C1|nr:hypothetical protein [uncultured Pontibacter sp.]
MMFLLILFALILSFIITAVVVIIGLIVINLIAKAYPYRISLHSVAKRTFWISWGINACIYFLLPALGVAFNGMNSLGSPWTAVLCSFVVAIVIFNNFQKLKVPYEKE